MVFLGLDGGGTGCRAALADAEGRILGRAEGGPANIVTDPRSARAAILGCAAGAAAQAGLTLDGVTAVFGLAGANVTGAAEALDLPFPARIVTDAEIAVAGALGPRDGIVALIGTGSVFAARRGKRLDMLGGRGLILGDEGGGGWIGRAALSRALRAADGLEDDTPFLAGLRARLGGIDGIIRMARNASPADFAAIAPEVLASHDPAARDIAAEAAGWAVRYIAALPADLPVCFTGGLGAAIAPLTGDAIAARRIDPAGSPLDGALALAREAADG